MAKRSTSSQNRKRSTGASKRSKSFNARKKTRRKPRKKSTNWQQYINALLNPAIWGVVFVLLGLVSLLSLLTAKPGTLTGWWLGQLSFVVGVGVYWTPVLFIVLGIFLYLQGSNHTHGFTFPRLLGVLTIWLVMQAAAHMLGSPIDNIQHAALQPGDYGGWIGWVLSQSILSTLGLGRSIAMALLLLLAFIGILLVLGTSRDDVVAAGNAGARSTGGFIASLPERWRNRQSGIIRLGPSRRERFREWFTDLRRPRKPVETTTNDLNGPITTLPPDPSAVRQDIPPMVDTPVRIIGGEQMNWRLPRVPDILEDAAAGELTEEDLAERARIIEDTLGAFGVPVTVVEVNRGPVVTQFGLRPEYITRKVRGEEKRMKVRVSKIQALSNDLSLALAASPIRIEAPVPGRNIVGLEVPNSNVTMVTLRSILESEEFKKLKGPLRVSLGQDVSGTPVAASLARMPHLLVAGATGSGKSVCVNAIICSLLFQCTPDELRFVMVDPKRVELTGYNGIPHLVSDVVTDIDKVVSVLQWATIEMDRRYKEYERVGARNIESYNAQRRADGRRIMPYIVIVIDELADIMMMSPDEVERSLVRIAQMARAVGIHLIIATQRPSVNVVTGLIKANFPSRIAFAVTSQIDSRVILDTPGAERLLGQGDMLFMRPDSAKLARLQGAFVSEAEIPRLIRYWRGLGNAMLQAQAAPAASVEPDETPTFVTEAPPPPPQPSAQRPSWDDMLEQSTVNDNRDTLFDDAVAVVQEAGRASTSLLQRRLRIGYTRAARLIDLLEEEGIVGPDQGGSRGREVLVGAETSAGDEPTQPVQNQDDNPPF